MKFYCEKDAETGKYDFFFENKSAVLMCGVRKKDVVRVFISEANEEEGTHWAYKDLKDNKFEFIFETKNELVMCSADSFKRSIELGEGKIVKIKLVEITNE